MTMRIAQLDYLKCVFIVLMVAFHLVYIGDSYPYAKAVVYTFHMSGFLLLSGFLFATDKEPRAFARSAAGLLAPYVVMEAAYAVMSVVMGVRENIGQITVSNVFRAVFLHPVGPYWFLHTLLVCQVAGYAVFRLGRRQTSYVRLLWLGLVLWGLSALPGGFTFSFANGCYFLAGMAVRQSGFSFQSVFRASLWSLLPLFLLCGFPANLDRGVLGGVFINYLVISLLFSSYRYMPQNLLRTVLFAGRNTLPVLLFSPLFTAASKLYQPLFCAFDPSGTVFLVVSVVLAMGGSWGLAWCADRLRLTACVFRRSRLLVP